MKKLPWYIMLVVVGLCGCATTPPAFTISNLDSGFAFKGQIQGHYSLQTDNIIVKVDTWRIRFGCHDQKERRLDSLQFGLMHDGESNQFVETVMGSTTMVDRVIRRGNDITLSNLTFTIPIKAVTGLSSNWLVAVYSDKAGDVQGWCYGHARNYLFSTNRTIFHDNCSN